MTDQDSGRLECPKCHKTYHSSNSKCPDDGSELVYIGAESEQDPLIGKLFADKYDIMSLLGEGGMSKVYKARHRFMKRTVAVKLLHESATKDATAKERFQQEAEAASALNHQNVVTVHDFGFTPSGQAFFVMDCLEGKSLEQLIEESHKPLDLAKCIDIFAQGLDGLDHAHRKGIIHRDIKPSNLVIIKQEDGTDLVKIVDFGIAKVMTPPVEGEKQRQLTQAGEVFGTPAYMSPEQCSGEPLDGRSDLYSYGCMMYESLSGQPPLLGETFINTVVKQLNERPKPIAETSPQAKVPPHVEAVVMKCLEKEPKQRYASAAALKQALLDAAFASGVQGLRFGAVPDPKQPHSGAGKSQILSTSLSVQLVTKRWRISLALTLAIVATLLSGLAWWLFAYPGPEGDTGTLFGKIMWQRHLSVGDDLEHQQKYDDAVREFEQAAAIAKQFGDGRSRLEITLNKLGEAYGLAHRYADQETTNKQIAQLITQRTLLDFDTLNSYLTEWEKPSASSTKRQELVLQASAFSERIAVCADKLSIHNREKEEQLLKKAIRVFDAMETGDWTSGVRFRVILAESDHVQQRFDEERALLKEAVSKCPDSPNTAEGWRQKILALMHLGQLDRNTSITNAELDHARSELDAALSWIRKYIPADKDLLREMLNSQVIMNKLYHTKECDAKAAEFEHEAKAIE